MPGTFCPLPLFLQDFLPTTTHLPVHTHTASMHVSHYVFFHRCHHFTTSPAPVPAQTCHSTTRRSCYFSICVLLPFWVLLPTRITVPHTLPPPCTWVATACVTCVSYFTTADSRFLGLRSFRTLCCCCLHHTDYFLPPLHAACWNTCTARSYYVHCRDLRTAVLRQISVRLGCLYGVSLLPHHACSFRFSACHLNTTTYLLLPSATRCFITTITFYVPIPFPSCLHHTYHLPTFYTITFCHHLLPPACRSPATFLELDFYLPTLPSFYVSGIVLSLPVLHLLLLHHHRSACSAFHVSFSFTRWNMVHTQTYYVIRTHCTPHTCHLPTTPYHLPHIFCYGFRPALPSGFGRLYHHMPFTFCVRFFVLPAFRVVSFLRFVRPDLPHHQLISFVLLPTYYSPAHTDATHYLYIFPSSYTYKPPTTTIHILQFYAFLPPRTGRPLHVASAIRRSTPVLLPTPHHHTPPATTTIPTAPFCYYHLPYLIHSCDFPLHYDTRGQFTPFPFTCTHTTPPFVPFGLHYLRDCTTVCSHSACPTYHRPYCTTTTCGLLVLHVTLLYHTVLHTPTTAF